MKKPVRDEIGKRGTISQGFKKGLAIKSATHFDFDARPCQDTQPR
jgi:hypothetical protein